MENNLSEYRCENCNKLFFKADIENAVIEIKCKNCKNISLIKNGENKALMVQDQVGTYKRFSAEKDK